MPLIRDNDFLGRLSGLLNLYSIDPSDAEVKRELGAMRRQVAQIWLDVDTDQLEALYRTPFGQLTQNLIVSGYAKEPLSQEELGVQQQLALIVSELTHPLALNAVMASLLFFPPTNVSFAERADRLLPAWLVQELGGLRERALLG
jgi:hypothetical protein